MISYEKNRSLQSGYLYHQNDTDLNFGLHIHNSFELIYCYSGELTVHIDKSEFQLSMGKAALILPNRIHSYTTKTHSKSYLCVFSSSYLSDYYVAVKDKTAVDPVFDFKNYENIILKLQNNDSNEFELKACFYTILGIFSKSAAYADRDKKLYGLLEKIIEYISDNYDKDVSLRSLASALGYDYHYLSGIVNKTLGTNFLKLVNEYRIQRARALLHSSDLTATEIAQSCGYDSVRSFNRNFTAITGTTPLKFRKELHQG